MKELKLDLCCLFGAAIGSAVVATTVLGISIGINALFVDKPATDADPRFPTTDELDWLFYTAIGLPLAAIAGLFIGWAFAVRRIRKHNPSYEIL